MKSHVNLDRLVPVDIAGHECYFNFSLRATQVLSEDFKDFENVSNVENEKNIDPKIIETMAGVYALLIQEGERYMRIVEKIEDVPTFTADELLTILNTNDMIALQESFTKAIELGSSREVEAKTSPKNAETT